MSSETPIFELKIKLTIKINKNAKLETEAIEIERAKVEQKEWKYPSAKTYEPVKLEEEVPSYIKYLLHDFISQTTYPKSCYISYIYMSTSDTSYICYDAVSVKHEQDVKETIAPASFIKVNNESSPFKEVEKIFIKILAKQKDEPQVCAQTKKAEAFVFDFLKKCAHVQINAKFIKIQNEGNEYYFTIDQEIKFFRYPWGEHLLVLPVPELPDPGKSPKHSQLLGIRSDNGQPDVIWGDVWKSLVKLNSILRTPGKKKIFIKGEPGSGKEVFANAIHYGSVRSKPDKLEVRSVAGANTKELRELLFGREIDGINIAGLIEKADGGTLFLDEFDKIEGKKFYSELLRVLEAEEYVPVNGKKIQKVGDVNWIFAGAFMGTDSSNPITDLPQDFWSRLTSLIDIKNPITPDLKKDYSYAGLIFLYFFIQEVVEMGEDVECVTSAGKGDYRSHIARLFIDVNQEKLLKADSNLIEMMRIFQGREEGINNGQYFSSGYQKDDPENNLCEKKETFWSYNEEDKALTPFKKYDSVRSIRQAAKVAFARCFNAALGLEEPAKNKVWLPDLENMSEIYEAIWGEIYKAIKEAAKTVFITRPGKQYKVRGKKTGAKG